eukprot:CAMPEP_0204529112 /NCGR_PEP_ID=MMETSP0661-20131031/9884_1 /ASSEMBLY_ACC=CAM_ASM_000606 /TAXON_ID=109239 /ORGANISM="Alexandrium margalefi, Strain AMGDE01CS-322" /LENGTH=818 /DNA_ID=CAMNT_0051535119 /DNA_START=37 /DNA_END=2493 /DNA_ORIENTATION=+
MPTLPRYQFALVARLLLATGTWAVATADATCAEEPAPPIGAVSALQRSGRQNEEIIVDEGVSNLMTSVASHVHVAAEMAKGNGLTHEEVSKQNKMLLASLHNLRESVEGGGSNSTPHLSGVDRKSLADVIEVIKQTMIGNLNQLHDKDQAEIIGDHASLVKCNADHQTTLSGVVAEASRRTQEARTSHITGRASESTLAITNSSKWSDYADLEKSVNAPACPTYTSSLSAMDSFFNSEDNSYIKWYLTNQADFRAKKGAYDSANNALNAKRSENDGLQRSFETHFCAYKGKQIDMCSTYATCRANALARYNTTKENVRLAEASRKAYLKSGHAVICHLKVILEHNTTHDHCEHELANANLTGLDIAYPSAPAANECTMDVAAASTNSPCTRSFQTTEYGDLASNVNPTSCMPCTWEPAPTPAPTSAPAVCDAFVCPPTHRPVLKAQTQTTSGSTLEACCVVQRSIVGDVCTTFFLDSAGNAWGTGSYRGTWRIGTNDTERQHSKLPIRSPMIDGSQSPSKVYKVSKGYGFIMFLLPGGTVWAAGGMMGRGKRINVDAVIDIEAGWNHCLLLRSDRTVWGFGQNGNNQLGVNGDEDWFPEPFPIAGIDAPVEAVAGGWDHTLFLMVDGTVRGVGRNTHGEMGQGTTSNSVKVPVQVPGIANAVQIASGIYHNVVLLRDGSVWTWGLNNHGQIGDGTRKNRYAPVRPQVVAGVAWVAATDRGTLFTLRDGSVLGAGANNWGQLGTGDMVDKYVPAVVKGVGNVTRAFGKERTVFFLLQDGTVRATGENRYGQLGDGTTTDTGTAGATTVKLESGMPLRLL